MEENILKSAQLKSTQKRQRILSILKESRCPITAEDIYQRALPSMHMSQSTVYRTLGALVEKKIALKSISQDGLTYYQLNTSKHHHQLVCTCCNETIPIDDCPLEALEKELADKTGFQITGHNLEFSGICPKCAKLSPPPESSK